LLYDLNMSEEDNEPDNDEKEDDREPPTPLRFARV
jgi:hypothetical protein